MQIADLAHHLSIDFFEGGVLTSKRTIIVILRIITWQALTVITHYFGTVLIVIEIPL